MRTCLSAAILMFVIPLFGEVGQWELVYPQEFPVLEDIPLNCLATSGDLVVVGGNHGYVIADLEPASAEMPAFDRTRAKVIKLEGISFNISALTKSDAGWIAGGEDGQIAVQRPDPSERIELISPYEQLSQNWRLSWDSFARVDTLLANGGSILAVTSNAALGRNELVISTDYGTTWRKVEGFQNVADVATLENNFYLLNLSTHGETLKIYRSQNGEIWDLLQEITTTGWTHSSANLSVGLDTFSSEDPSQSERLYLSAWFRDFDPWVDRNTRYELFISTMDGQSWLDHGSTIENVTEGTLSVWNPLNLEEGELSQSRGDFFDRDFTSGAYSLVSFPREGILQFHNVQNWIQIFSSSPKRASQNNLAVWGNISFLDELGTGNPNLVTLFKSGEVQVTAPPIEDASFWGGWTNLNGIYFAIISDSSGMKVLHSSDLVNWSKLPFAVGDSYGRLTFSDGKIASRLNDKLFVWSGLSWSSPVPLVTDSEDIAYNEHTDDWYTLSYAGDEVMITSANDGDTFASFIPQTWNEYFTKLDCPDGELLISYGNSAEIAVIFPDSSVFLAHPWEFFGSSAYKFDSVAYVNGWYYFLGKPTVRTKDFVKFEEVPLPADYTLINVSGWNGSLYGFVDGAVFRKPLDRGYLESIEMTHGWLHAEWLGWFQIIDEEKGDIDHLLLGDCWVKQVNEQQCWLRTSTLGWIYIYKDWSPWFWRMDDGHWYWLDQDGWPPRAWDYDDQEWEEIQPTGQP